MTALARALAASLRRFPRSDIGESLRRSPGAQIALLLVSVLTVSSFLAPWIAPHDPFDLSQVNLMDASDPPFWIDGGNPQFLLGTDNQGRDILSAILYGMRLSLTVGFLSIALAALIGVALGLLSAYAGGFVDHALMRLADVQLSFPAILIALTVDGLARAFLTAPRHADAAVLVLVLAIGLSKWAMFARTVRGSALVELDKDYVAAARLIRRRPVAIALLHVLPNTVGPIMVLATVNFGLAVITEATLSFLGVGLPPNTPSLGTLIQIGNGYLFSGQWWMTLFPGAALTLLVVSVNVVGDWLRDALSNADAVR
jgi:peptide/nickel transport system permease protein